MQIGAQRLAKIKGRLRAGNHHLNPTPLPLAQPLQKRARRINAKGHRILVRQRHRLLLHQQIVETGAVQSAMHRQLLDIHTGATPKHVHRFYAY
ncbi:MAG: hypothetical protein M2R46_00004 [Verrucomicrobia subdivision 3 bacterium]|nr:hypothetical protein [Limisphaerales bacterium]